MFWLITTSLKKETALRIGQHSGQWKRYKSEVEKSRVFNRVVEDTFSLNNGCNDAVRPEMHNLPFRRSCFGPFFCFSFASRRTAQSKMQY
jgi:hypothetical protein